MELLQIKCPTCHSAVLQSHTTYATQHHGRRIIYKCTKCPTYFSETKKTLMAGVKTPVSVIWQVIKARTEGMGLNAAARTFEKAKNTILAWERKFHDLHQVLFLYALVQEFLLKRCTKSSSNLRFYEETMCCKLDSAPEPISPGATHRSSPCCVATPRSRIVDPVPHRFWFTGGLSPQDHR